CAHYEYTKYGPFDFW
nr:immunoglobulin heavy chain junction region [Macaca mulatta]